MAGRIVHTACPRDCWDTCALLVEVENGRVTGVRGDADHEITRGFICRKARYEMARLYSPQRLLYPMIKRRGEWERVAWNEAIELVASRLQQAREKDGSLSVLHYSDKGTMGWLNDLEERFFNLFGGVTLPKGSLCAAAGNAAQVFDMGNIYGHDPMDFINARAVIIWGRNPAHTNIHLLPIIREAKNRGAVVTVIDPVPTDTAKIADHYISPRPGTDGALALGMARVILEEGLEDQGFIASSTFGFEDYRQMVNQYPLDKVAQITGVPTSTILEMSRQYATTKPGCLIIGYGVQRYQNGGAAVRAIDALAAITGNIGVSGGGANYGNTYSFGLKLDISGRTGKEKRRTFPKAAIAWHILEASEPPVKVLFVTRANPINQLPNTSLVQEAFKSVEFKVVIDLVMTETAAMADVFLPATTFFEQENIYGSWWHNDVTYGERAIEPLGESRPDWEIFYTLAERLGIAGEFGPSKMWIDELLRPFAPLGDSRQLLGKTFRCPGALNVPWADGAFKTPSGKFEFFSARCQKSGADPLPVFRESRENLLNEQLPAAQLPFYLLTPQHRQTIHSQYFNRVEPGERVHVHLNGEAAKRKGIEQGGLVTVKSARGAVTGSAVLHSDYREDVVVIYGGGSPGQGKGANFLTPDGITDIGTGAIYYDCLCDVQPDHS
ncbi:MAG: molybdopterin-dependent oxidoreductase [Bacillota bacterium]